MSLPAVTTANVSPTKSINVDQLNKKHRCGGSGFVEQGGVSRESHRLRARLLVAIRAGVGFNAASGESRL